MTDQLERIKKIKEELRNLGRNEEDIVRIGRKVTLVSIILIGSGVPIEDPDMPDVFRVLAQIEQISQDMKEINTEGWPKC